MSSKVYIITGANRGLGLTFVTHLASDPANTIIAATRSLSRDLTALEALKAKSRSVHILECDTSSLKSIEAFAKQVESLLGPNGKVDFLLNNAGINTVHYQTSLDITPEGLSDAINVNVLGPAKTVEALQEHLQEGSVVMNMTSGLGSLAAAKSSEVAKSTVYSISKAALNMLTVHQSKNLASKGVIVICMDPGWVKTDMGGAMAPLYPDESIGGMLKCLNGLKADDSGKYYLYDGTQRQW